MLDRWGFIQSFRFDNGRPFGDPTRQSLSICVLRLLAMGIQSVLNPPGRPTCNAKVERCQGTTGRWAFAAKCPNIEQFIQKLSFATHAQRERLPTRVCKGLTRAQYFPELFNNPRRFDPADFKMERVFQFLSTGSWQRRISSVGTTDMFGKTYQIGYPHRGKDAIVKFDAAKQQWLFFDKDLKLLNAIYASNLTPQNLYALSFGQ